MIPHLLAVIAALAGCAHEAGSSKSPPRFGEPQRHHLDIDTNGLSGLARDGKTLWAVSERGHKLIALNRDGRVLRTLPIAGLPTGYDLESIARLGPRRLAAGSETSAERWQSQEGKAAAEVFILDIGDKAATVTETIRLPFSIWSVEPKENQGIEGLCQAGGKLIAGIETVIVKDGRRFAPLAIRDVAGGPWQPRLLALTSREGKLSSLDCAPVGTSIRVVAVERHFGVMRILRFQLDPDAGVQQVAEPRIVTDLSTYIARDSINVEGIVQLDDGAFAMIVDNEFKSISGPNELVVLPAFGR